MSVSSIFKTLIIVVVCIIIGAAVINIFAPNLVAQLSNAIENSIYKATGMTFDFNGDGTAGSDALDVSGGEKKASTTGTSAATDAKNVSGFSSGGSSGGSSGK